MKVLVTGSRGSLGRAFTEYLASEGISFCRYERDNPAATETDYDVVVNFAGMTPHSAGTPTEDYEARFAAANIEGTANILSFISKNKKLKRLVHIGSGAEYGSSNKTLAESAKASPDNVYGKTKLEQTHLIEGFARTRRIKTFNLRLFNLLGVPRSASQKRKFIDEYLLEQAIRNTRHVSVSNARDARDYIDLRDAFSAILAALKSTRGSVYELVNISSGRGTTLGELAKIFEKKLQRKLTLRNTARASSRYVGDPRKAKKLLGWQPTHSIENIVDDAISRKKRVLMVGAGIATELVLQEFEKDPVAGTIVTGIVDDAKKTRGKTVRGVKVLGEIKDIARLSKHHQFDEILISTPSAGAQVAAKVAEISPLGVPIRVLPSISSVILGKVDLANIRNIDPSDIIGRPLIKTDQQLISSKTSGRSFLVTGGAGSIGSEIVRQLFDSQAKKVVVLDSSEEGIFNLSESLKAAKSSSRPELVFKIANIRDRERLEEIAAEQKIDVIVHAAAYKHVPLMEENPDEARKTNVEGTRNLLDLALAHSIRDFVLVSTDKAVNPPNVMGKTKRQAELLVKEYARKNPGTRFMAVRFGNVLNSSGSMLPTFLRQIQSRSALTLTHRDVTRYFMSIPEAASLVLMSWVVGERGQILLLDMGKPVKIRDFAEKLIRMHGLIPYEDIEIVEIGLRPGEKLHEELAYDETKLRESKAPRIFIAEELE